MERTTMKIRFDGEEDPAAVVTIDMHVPDDGLRKDLENAVWNAVTARDDSFEMVRKKF